jgi:DnaJ-class molecular chaperone
MAMAVWTKREEDELREAIAKNDKFLIDALELEYMLEQKALGQLASAGIISWKTLCKSMGLDMDAEAEKMRQEFGAVFSDREPLPFTLVKPSKCPDCKGTKVYIGFNKIEPCTKCKGKGTV